MPLETPVEKLTAEDCQRELADEGDLNRLRSLVAVKRLLSELQGVTCKLEADVQGGKVRNWRYPRQLKVS